jgi:hypothetical protein
MFTLWDLCPFLDAVTTKVTSIVQKQPEIAEVVAMEVNLSTVNLARRVCQRISLDPDSHSSTLGAAEMLAFSLNGLQAQVSSTTWYDFRTSISTVIATHLPPKPDDTKEAHSHEEMAIALLSQSGYQVNKKGKGMPSSQAPGTAPSWFVCSKCGERGHYLRTCQKPQNPDAKRLFAEAMEMRAKM